MGVAVKCRSIGCEECSAGESKGTMKSSRFIGSEVVSCARSPPAGDGWSDKRICAMPLGVGLKVSEALFGHQ